MSKKSVTEIWVYPVKSLGGIRLKAAKVLPKGLQYDRRWMLIDMDNSCMTQRVYPQMAIFKLSFEAGEFTIHYIDQEMQLPFGSCNDSITATIWNDKVEVNEVSRVHSEWISGILGVNCRLVSFPENNPRRVHPDFSINNEHVSLADAYPFLIIGEASLAHLNGRMNEPLPMNRFRPNIVFSGGEAYEEDVWKNFSIGKNRFAAVKPCSRCVLTTVDQYEGKKMGVEPLATLATYRKWDNNVYFGQNLLPLNFNEIREGDEIILEVAG